MIIMRMMMITMITMMMMKNKSKFDLKPPTTASTFYNFPQQSWCSWYKSRENTFSCLKMNWNPDPMPWWRFCKRWTHSMVEFLEFWHQMPSTPGAKWWDLRKWKILHPALRCFCIQLRDVFAFEMAPEWNRIYMTHVQVALSCIWNNIKVEFLCG